MQNRQVIEENDHHQQIVEQKVHMQIIVSLYHLNNHLLIPMASLGIIQGLLIPMASLGTIQGLTLWQLVHFGRTIQVRFVAKKKNKTHTKQICFASPLQNQNENLGIYVSSIYAQKLLLHCEYTH